MAVEIHVGILPQRAVEQAVDLGMAAEAFGYKGVWVADSHSVMRDAYVVVTLLAAKTRRIQLAAGVSPTVTRHPAVLANSWATLQEISNGRAILGVGVGESAVHNLGLKPERLAVLEDKIRVIRALFSGEPVEYEGRSIQMPWSECEVPVVMACSGPKSLQLGGRIADGVLFQVGSNPAFVRYALDNIRKGAEQAGRNLEDVKLYMRVACAVSEDRDKAREEAKGYVAAAAGTTFKTVPKEYFDEQLWHELERFKSNYDYAEHARNDARHKSLLTDRIIDAIAIAGTPSEAIPRFQELAGMGLDGFVWPAAMPEPIPYLETFARDVMPQL
jgi:5,10-methylenetetrahydromethanopterin reductase